jgi:hypothetical protein
MSICRSRSRPRQSPCPDADDRHPGCPVRRAAPRNRPQHDVSAVAARSARRRRVEPEAKPRRAADRDCVGGVEVVAALQPRHTVGAIEVIDDLAQLVLVDRAACDTIVAAVNVDPDRVPGLERDTRGSFPDAEARSESRAGAQRRGSATHLKPSSGQASSDSQPWASGGGGTQSNMRSRVAR